MKKRHERTIDERILGYWDGRLMATVQDDEYFKPLGPEEETEATFTRMLKRSREAVEESNSRVDHMQFMRSQGHQFLPYTNQVSRETREGV